MDALDARSLQMRCAAPGRPRGCPGAVATAGFFSVACIGAGLLLLALGLACLAHFRLLPWLQRRLRGPSPKAKVPRGGVPGPPLEPAPPWANALRMAGAGAPPPDVGSGPRPPGQESCSTVRDVWVSRRVFLCHAAFSAAFRLAVVAWCAAVLDFLGIAIFEALLCVLLPLLWCAITSRPSRQGNTLDGVYSAAYVCCRLQRFSTFAAVILVAEVFSVVATASAVASASCSLAPWQALLPYFVGVMVTVARAHTAVLAMRLQDEFARACTQVQPFSDLEAIAEAAAAKETGVCDPDCIQLSSAHVQTGNFLEEEQQQQHPERRRCCGCARTSQGSSWKKKLLRRRTLLVSLLVGKVLAGTIAVLVVHLTGGAGRESEPLSSCSTAQNGTATCEEFVLTGSRRWEAATSLEACCKGCDSVADCQGWIFERVGRRCRWIRFLEDPCSSNPGALECRCLTHQVTSFGFKPVGQIVWLHTSR